MASFNTEEDASSSRKTLLLDAARVGDIKAVWKLLNTNLSNADIDLETNNADGVTPLMCAAYLGETTLVKILLDAGANVQARDMGGWTPLMNAVYNGGSETVQALLAAGADPEAKDNLGNTPMIRVEKRRKMQKINEEEFQKIKTLLDEASQKRRKK